MDAGSSGSSGIEYYVHAFDEAEPAYIIRVEHRREGLRRGWIARRDRPSWVHSEKAAYSVDPHTSNSEICIDRRYALALLERWGGEPDDVDEKPILPFSNWGPVCDWLAREFGS